MAGRRTALAQRRKMAGFSQEALAGKLGIDPKTVRRWESGETQNGPQPWLRQALGECLGVAPSALEKLFSSNPSGGSTQESVLQPSGQNRSLRDRASLRVPEQVYPVVEGVHSVFPAIRRAMQEASFSPGSLAEPVPCGDLERRISQAWLTWHSSPAQRTDVGVLLPELIRDAHDCVRGHDQEDRRRAQAATGDLYRLVQRLLAHIAEPELHVLAVERGRAMSEEADRPDALALAAWSSAIAASARGQFEEAVRIAEAGTQETHHLIGAVNSGSPEALAVYGALQLESAAAHGFAGRGDEAARHLDLASSVAGHLPQGYWHRQSGFESTSIDILSVIIEGAQGNVGHAIQQAERIDPSTVPSLVRRSRLLLELALGQARRHEPFAAIHYLKLAVSESSEAVTTIPWAADLAVELVKMAPRTLRGTALEILGHFGRPLPARSDVE
jgi:DNA-binding XRE family transcriptional regulator